MKGAMPGAMKGTMQGTMQGRRRHRLSTAMLRSVPGRLRARLRWALGRSILLVVTLALACTTAFLLGHASLIEEARFARPLDATLIVDRHGRPLRRHLPEHVDTRWVSLEEISPALIDAFVAAEDERFFTHPGLDGVAMARALGGNLLGSRLSGASTLTQQVVKLVYGRPHGLWDKPLEMARALELELRMSKDEILEQYLNRVPMGNGIVGVGRAAEAYFGHGVDELTLSEAALLAGIPQAPSITEPRRHLARALRRRSYVLDRLEELELASDEEIAAARETAIAIVTDAPRPYVAARFVDRVLEERRASAMGDAILETSLDRALTERAEELLAQAVLPRRARGAENAAAIAVDVRSGEVLVYVGAALPDAEGGALDLLRARRQPGSTLKPFAYELFFEDGESPATLVDDLSSGMTLGDGTSFVARDFDGHERGPVRARVALGSSLNLAAIDVVRRVTAGRFVERLEGLSFSRAHDADRESAALVLGGIDVTAIELAQAYAVLARGGGTLPLSLFRRSEPSEGERVLDPTAVALTVDVLSDASVRASAFGRTLEDEAGGPFALKTGTSEGFHDAWAVAFDSAHVVVVWVGSPARRAMDHVSGFEASAPVAASLLGALRRADPLVAAPIDRVALATVHVCALSGGLPGPGCSATVAERFAPARLPHEVCSLHHADGSVHLPERYAAWLARQPMPAAVADLGDTPRLRSPRDGATLLVDRVSTEVTLTGEGAVHFEVDGVGLEGDRWRPTAGRHVLVAVGLHARSAPSHVTVVAYE